MEKRFFKIMNYAADADLKNSISSVHNDLKGKGFLENQHTAGAKIIQLKNRRSSRFVLAISAVAAILIASWFIFNRETGTSIDTDVVFSNNYKPENKLIESYLLPSAGTMEGDFRIALDQYEHEEFTTAKDLLTPLHKQSPENDAVTFYLALSNLGLDDVNSSIALLEPLLEKESKLKTAIKWYLGLAYLKNKEQKKASSIFENLVKSSDEEYSAKATLILRELE